MSLSDLPHLSLDNFEGPFDVLIELARAEKIDLTTVSLSRITDSYLQYLKEVALPASTQADFLVVAATLLLIKLNQLLPELAPDEAAEVAELTDRVRVYQRYRVVALELKAAWNQVQLLPPPAHLRLLHQPPFPRLTSDTLAETLRYLIRALKPTPNPQRHLRPRGRTLGDTVMLLRQRLAQLSPIVFQEEFNGQTRDTVATSLLATLELVRQQQVRLEQVSPCAALHLYANQ